MRKTPLKKRVTRSLKPKSNVDPTRVALQALERIKTVLVKSGHKDRLGDPLSMKELASQSQLIGTELPPSYVAAMRVASKIGAPDHFLSTKEMETEAERIALDGGEEARRYAPFCRGSDVLICFDKGGGRRLVSSIRHQGELPIVEWQDRSASPVAAHFGEWLDLIADAREESVENAAKMPPRLKRLLYELGFRFEYPVVGRLETGDVDAVVELIGRQMARTVRADVDRLFDATGKASLTLNVDDFTMRVTLRTGTKVFEAEDVFRWLRTFRDENFFSDVVSVPNHPDVVRDLRRAPREPPLIQRGVLHVAVLPASKLSFKSASGGSADDFYLLGRGSQGRGGVILHVVDGVIATSHTVEEPVHELFIARDGTMWGLTTTAAVRLSGGRSQTYPLQRPTRGRPWWYGIGGLGDRVLVWGTGALLEFDGRQFVPFEPDAMLDEVESVIALQAHGSRIWMLVCGENVGAVARYDGRDWEPITDNQVIEAELADLDMWRGTAYVLDKEGGLWKVDGAAPPRPVALLTYHQAYLTEQGAQRPLLGVRALDNNGLLLASTGGIISVGAGEPLFHAIPNGREPMRLMRVGPVRASARDTDSREPGIVALSGGNAWIWRGGTFNVIDMHDW